MQTVYCPHCNYNLTGVEHTGACPECGKAFELHELLRHGGMPPVKVGVIFLMLAAILAPPMIIAAVTLVLAGQNAADDVIGLMMLFVVLPLGLLGLTISILVGRRVARRLVQRPPGSRPNVSSVTLTIVFAGILFAAQCAVFGVCFFFGCLAIM